MTLRYQFMDLPLDRIEADVALAPFFTGIRPLSGASGLLDWRLSGALTRMLVAGSARGERGEAVVFKSNQKIAADWAYFVGGGGRPPEDREGTMRLLDAMVRQALKAGFRRIALASPSPLPGDFERWDEMFAALASTLPTGTECFFSFPAPARKGSGR